MLGTADSAHLATRHVGPARPVLANEGNVVGRVVVGSRVMADRVCGDPGGRASILNRWMNISRLFCGSPMPTPPPAGTSGLASSSSGNTGSRPTCRAMWESPERACRDHLRQSGQRHPAGGQHHLRTPGLDGHRMPRQRLLPEAARTPEEGGKPPALTSSSGAVAAGLLDDVAAVGVLLAGRVAGFA